MTPFEVLRAVAMRFMLWGSFGLAGAVLAISQEIAYLDPLCCIDYATAMRRIFKSPQAANLLN